VCRGKPRFAEKNGGASSKLGKSSTKIAQPHDFIKHSIKAKSRKNAEFQRFYEAGLSLRQIEDRTGVSKTKIRQELEKAGVVIRDFSRGSKQKNDPTQVMKSGTTPFGHTYLEGKLVVEPSEYRIVLEIARRVHLAIDVNSIGVNMCQEATVKVTWYAVKLNRNEASWRQKIFKVIFGSDGPLTLRLAFVI